MSDYAAGTDLEEPSGDGDDALDDELNQLPDDGAREQAAETKIWVTEATRHLTMLDAAQDERALELQDASPEPVNNVTEVVPDEDPTLNRQVETLRQMMEPIADAHAEARKWAKAKYLLWTFKLVSSVATVLGLYAGLKALIASGSPPSGDDATADLLARAKAWLAESDTDFWNDLADYLKANHPSVDEQILFMQYTEDLYLSQQPPPAVWMWSSAADKAALVTGLVADLTSDGIAAVYTSMPARTYNGIPIRRDIAADLLSLALAQLRAASLVAGGDA